MKSFIGIHTGERIGQAIRNDIDALQEVVASLLVVGSTTDVGSNMIVAFEHICKFKREHCAGHNMHLGVTDALELVATLLGRLRYIVKATRKSPKKLAALRTEDVRLNAQLPRGEGNKLVKNSGRTLKIDMPIRWNSSKAMVHRAVDMRDSITTVTATRDFNKRFPAATQLTPDEKLRLKLSERFAKPSRLAMFSCLFDPRFKNITTYLPEANQAWIGETVSYLRAECNALRLKFEALGRDRVKELGEKSKMS